MADKRHSDSQSIIEALEYNPDVQDTEDLEGATNTIAATSEASGVGSADYSKAKTLPIPDDVRMKIKRIGTRLQVTIDSDDGTQDLHCRVYVDAQDADHMLFDQTWTDVPPVTQIAVQDCFVGTKETIFDLLKDGNAHTFYFFFWSPGNHSPVISLVQLEFGVGSTGTHEEICFTVEHEGFFQLGHWMCHQGSGTSRTDISNALSHGYTRSLDFQSSVSWHHMNANFGITNEGICIVYWGSVATDLKCLREFRIHLRSEL